MESPISSKNAVRPIVMLSLSLTASLLISSMEGPLALISSLARTIISSYLMALSSLQTFPVSYKSIKENSSANHPDPANTT